MGLCLGLRLGLGNLPLTSTGNDAATTALLAAMSVQPNAARITVINNAIVSLKNNGLWTKMGLLYVNAAHDEQAGRLNWVNPGTSTLTAVNSPTFTADRGFAGDAVSMYLTTGVAENAVPNYSQDNAHVGVWSVTAGTLNKNVVGKDVGGTGLIAIQTNNVSGFAVQINGGGSIVGLDAPVNTGHVVGVRNNSTDVVGYRNGANVITGTKTSSAPDANIVTLLRLNSVYADQQMALLHLGTKLTDAEATSLYNIFRTYMTAVGVP
jgi:hypothetical protein